MEPGNIYPEAVIFIFILNFLHLCVYPLNYLANLNVFDFRATLFFALTTLMVSRADAWEVRP